MTRASDRDQGTGLAAAPLGAAARLVDRASELRVFEQSLKATTDGRGRPVVVTGPIGIGKTTLLDAVARLAAQSGAQVIRAVAATLERHLPFAVVRQLCEPVVSVLTEAERKDVAEGMVEDVRPFLTDQACVAGAEWELAGKQAVPDAMRHLFSVVAVRQPIVLVVDDVQFADAESLRCLGYLARRLSGLAVLLVVAVRDGIAASDEAQLRHLVRGTGEVLRPTPLSLDGVQSMIHTLFGESGSEQFANACRSVSKGNPLVVRAVLEEVRGAGGRPTAEFVELVRACRPPILRERVLARLRGQPAAAIAYLKALWCLGQAADLALIARFADLDPVTCTEVAHALTRQGLLCAENPGRFAHPVMGDAAGRLINAPEAECLHGRAATVLHEAGHPADHVAPHLLAVPAEQDAWAVDVLREASAQALGNGDTTAAARYLRRAMLERSPYSGSRAELLLELAATERDLDRFASVRHVLEATALSTTPSTRAAAITWLPPLTVAATGPAVGAVVRAVAEQLGDPDALTGHDHELALRLETRLRVLEHGPQHVDAALRRLRGLDRERCLATAAGRELLAVLIEIAAATGTGPSDELADTAKRILDLETTSATTLVAVPMVISTLALADRAAAATGWLDAAAAGVAQHKDAAAVATVATCQALVHLAAGEISQGVATASTALALAGGHWSEAVTLTGLVTAAGLGELRRPDAVRDGRRELADTIVGLCTERSGEPLATTLRRLLTGHCATSTTGYHEVVEHLQDCGRQLDRLGWRNPAVFPWRTYAALLHHQLGNGVLAADFAETEHELATAWGAPAVIGRALRVRGMITPGPQGVALLRSAADVLEDSENRLEQARTHLTLGARLVRTGAAGAEHHLRRGRALSDSAAAQELAQQMTERIPLTEPPGNPLTNAERRVVALAAAGHTNQAIADELAVSRRAVEKHLTRVYGKLNIAGRAELADAWASDPKN